MFLCSTLLAIAAAASDLEVQVDRLAAEALKTSGVPSLSIAVVKDGQVALAKAYGTARLPKTPAAPAMHYAIGSISKQFTAAAVLLLVDEKKLSLDDKVAKFLPELTGAAEIRVRDLLAHTAGIQDYWPQDYVPAMMEKETTAAQVLERWAKQPLDFAPGTKWQYSNTGYVVAGLIAEKVSGVPLFDFLKKRVFEPLGMDVVDVNAGRLGESDPVGYTHFALGPPRAAVKEGHGWLFAAGGLAMSAQDLAKWNIALAEGKLLSASSLAELSTEVRLKNGVGTDYGLGVDVAMEGDRRRLEHGGEVSGFTAYNIVYPDHRAAVTVLANDDAHGWGTTVDVARRLVPLLFGSADAAAEARARKVLEGLQKGQIDRTLLSENASAWFSPVALKDIAASLKAPGAATKVEQVSWSLRGGMTTRRFNVSCQRGQLSVVERDLPDGRIEQFQVMPLLRH